MILLRRRNIPTIMEVEKYNHMKMKLKEYKKAFKHFEHMNPNMSVEEYLKRINL